MTCFQLLEILGVESTKIEPLLDYYGIISPEMEQHNLEMGLRLMEEEEEKWNSGWYEKRYDAVQKRQSLIDKSLNELVRFDLSRAETVIGNIYKLTKDEEDFEFLCTIFDHNFASLDTKGKKELRQIIADFMRKKNSEAWDKMFNNDQE
ncbi:hypothetical protein DFQ01_101520 [Paenibacillus cellulosilyticus]|uniref:Uncharacterized protein n=1 Tax=Paenibacillus cellulosilyticus TaxID=375489 RepID=A0A2V2Z146_9BACL|nr:hypothetical protein [Paenibacillus cellulosilyticus]PWW08794.1 hypothetical protein DFQ01_101520 [Paenibacillus cellulosilyticus]QKS48346.1 hypothetical protein HUB94_29235 [Paenibacillus cellulosilyticus]